MNCLRQPRKAHTCDHGNAYFADQLSCHRRHDRRTKNLFLALGGINYLNYALSSIVTDGPIDLTKVEG